MRIFNSRLLDPNQEHQTLIPIENTPRGGWIGVQANLMHNNVKLKLSMQIKKYYVNTQNITQECSWIPGEGLWNISSRFLQIKSRGATMALLVEYKCEQTIQAYNNKHKIYQAYKEKNNISMQDI